LKVRATCLSAGWEVGEVSGPPWIVGFDEVVGLGYVDGWIGGDDAPVHEKVVGDGAVVVAAVFTF
jgi:hypothetical protein